MRVNAEKMMKEYKNLKMELQVTEMQLGRFQGITESDVISMMTFSHPDSEDRVQTSSLSDKTAKTAMNYRKVMERENDEWYRFLLNRKRKLTEEITFFEDSLRSIDEEMAEVVLDLIRGEMSWDEIQSKHNISRMQITRYKRKAIEKLNIIYSFRNQQAEDYMLS
jgi:Trp operon repressor